MFLFRVTIKVGKEGGEKFILGIFNTGSKIFIIIKLYVNK